MSNPFPPPAPAPSNEPQGHSTDADDTVEDLDIVADQPADELDAMFDAFEADIEAARPVIQSDRSTAASAATEREARFRAEAERDAAWNELERVKERAKARLAALRAKWKEVTGG